MYFLYYLDIINSSEKVENKEFTMKDMDLTSSDATSVIRTCTQTLFDNQEIPLNVATHNTTEETITCREVVGQLSVNVQERLCENPFVLIKEKNPLMLGKAMFHPAIEQIGCDVATALLSQPFMQIQKEACDLTQTQSIAHKIPPVIEFIGQRCQVTVSMPTRREIVACYPTYNASATEEMIQQSLNETTEHCQQVMQKLPYGEKLKLCDTIESALLDETPPEKILERFTSAKKDSESFPSRAQPSPEHEEIKQNKRMIFLNKNYIGDRIVERTACEDLQRPEFPLEKNKPLFIQIERACFEPYSFPLGMKRPQIAVEDSYFEECQSFVESLPTQDKQLLCEENLKTTFAQYYYSPFFMKTTRSIRAGCQDDTAQPIEENLSATLQEIAKANSARGIITDESSDHPRLRRHLLFHSAEQGDKVKPLPEQSDLVLKETLNKANTAISILNTANTVITAYTTASATLSVLGSISMLATGIMCLLRPTCWQAKTPPQNDPLLAQEETSKLQNVPMRKV
jgi:hypothetical protein